MTTTRYDVEVELIGTDGNAFAILGKVKNALRDAEVPEHEIRAFIDEATAGDYDHLLQTVLAWVEVT
jgi:hypothetical protein